MYPTTTEKEGITVLSLFDGIGGARLALDRAGIKIKRYYSSEIDPVALKVLDHHYGDDPKYVQLGDVREIDATDYLSDEVDLIIFGSPCTNLSSINPKDKRGLEGEESKLFYEALRIVKEVYMLQPPSKQLFIIMENVASMRKRDREIITRELSRFLNETTMFSINSSLVAPAHRRRLYWTNIPNVEPPDPNSITYQDILVNGYVDREKANPLLSGNVTLTSGIFRHYKMQLGNIIFQTQEFANLSTEEKLEQYPQILEQSGYEGKSGSNGDEYAFPNGCYRLPSVLESERLMTLPDGYLGDVTTISRSDKLKCIGLGFTVDVVSHLLSYLPDALEAIQNRMQSTHQMIKRDKSHPLSGYTL